MAKFKTPSLKNPNPNKVKVFSISGKARVSPGNPILGGTTQRELGVKKIPGEVSLGKFYKK